MKTANNGGRLSRLTGATNAADNCRQLTASEFISTAGDNGEAVDPNGQAYNLQGCTMTQWNNRAPANGQVFVVVGADCNGADNAGRAQPNANDSTRAFAIYGYLEGGTYCSASQ